MSSLIGSGSEGRPPMPDDFGEMYEHLATGRGWGGMQNIWNAMRVEDCEAFRALPNPVPFKTKEYEGLFGRITTLIKTKEQFWTLVEEPAKKKPKGKQSQPKGRTVANRRLSSDVMKRTNSREEEEEVPEGEKKVGTLRRLLFPKGLPIKATVGAETTTYHSFVNRHSLQPPATIKTGGGKRNTKSARLMQSELRPPSPNELATMEALEKSLKTFGKEQKLLEEQGFQSKSSSRRRGG